MDFAINRKALIYIGLLLISISLFWLIKPMTDKLEIAKNISYSSTSLTTINDIINQINMENENENNTNSSNSSSNENTNKPSLKDEIESSKTKLSKNEYKAAKSNYNKMLEHIEKLEKYKKNPFEFDNQNLLRNAPNEQIKQKIIQSRINHLEKEIQTFYNNIIKIIK
jgi:hypothetical protein